MFCSKSGAENFKEILGSIGVDLFNIEYLMQQQSKLNQTLDKQFLEFCSIENKRFCESLCAVTLRPVCQEFEVAAHVVYSVGLLGS